jgi:hypothetical protein
MINYPSSFKSGSPSSVANIFGNWLHGVDHWFMTLIRVGHVLLFGRFGTFPFTRNDKVFNEKNSSPLQVI